jgi:APA family basic amino acid/polyamine antiporter
MEALEVNASRGDSGVPSGTAATDGLRRVIGPASATSIVVGAIIGVGIFFAPSNVARIAGSADMAMWIWAAGGLVALLGALTFAELGGMYGHWQL